MDLDAALQDLGQFGKFQVYYFTLLLFPLLITAFRGSEYVFTTMNIPHRCRVSQCEKGAYPLFSPPWLAEAVPEGSDHTPLPCQKYRPRYPLNSTIYNNSCPADLFTDVTESCYSWVFSEPSTISIGKDFNILCPDHIWKLTFLSSIPQFTGFLGEPLSGAASDRIGRKNVLLYGCITICVVGLIRSFSVNYIMLAVLEGFDGLISGALFTPVFLLGLETLSPKKRLLGCMLINIYWPFGEMGVGIVMWLVQDWRMMLRVVYGPMLIISILLLWLLPESVRWLYTRGRWEEVKQICKKIAHFNNTEACLPQIFNNLDQERECRVDSKKQDGEATKSLRLRAVLRSPVLLWRTGVCALCWVINEFSYNGTSLNAVSLGSNQYLSYILVCAVEIPSYVVTLWMPDWRWLGRRGGLVVSFVTAGIPSLVSAFISTDDAALNIFLFLVAKFCSTTGLTILILYTAEVFPTEVRNSLYSFCTTCARFGAIAVQQTPLLKGVVSPMLLIGLSSVLGGALALTCQETMGMRLPDTLEEAVEIGSSRNRQKPSTETTS